MNDPKKTDTKIPYIRINKIIEALKAMPFSFFRGQHFNSTLLSKELNLKSGKSSNIIHTLDALNIIAPVAENKKMYAFTDLGKEFAKYIRTNDNDNAKKVLKKLIGNLEYIQKSLEFIKRKKETNSHELGSLLGLEFGAKWKNKTVISDHGASVASVLAFCDYIVYEGGNIKYILHPKKSVKRSNDDNEQNNVLSHTTNDIQQVMSQSKVGKNKISNEIIQIKNGKRKAQNRTSNIADDAISSNTLQFNINTTMQRKTSEKKNTKPIEKQTLEALEIIKKDINDLNTRFKILSEKLENVECSLKKIQETLSIFPAEIAFDVSEINFLEISNKNQINNWLRKNRINILQKIETESITKKQQLLILMRLYYVDNDMDETTTIKLKELKEYIDSLPINVSFANISDLLAKSREFIKRIPYNKSYEYQFTLSGAKKVIELIKKILEEKIQEENNE